MHISSYYAGRKLWPLYILTLLTGINDLLFNLHGKKPNVFVARKQLDIKNDRIDGFFFALVLTIFIIALALIYVY